MPASKSSDETKRRRKRRDDALFHELAGWNFSEGQAARNHLIAKNAVAEEMGEYDDTPPNELSE